jgi:Ni,Fe-hydrogenase III small subunit/NAD-dependent dihydropyrimidine dehydrogenase PreA subunit
MRNPLLAILSGGVVTQRELFPDLPAGASGLPMVTASPCEGMVCRRCMEVCPTRAINVTEDREGGVVALDRGRCIGCSGCIETCPTGTLVADRSTRTAVRERDELVLTNRPGPTTATNDQGPTTKDQRRTSQEERRASPSSVVGHSSLVVRPTSSAPFRRSLHIREVSTGCNATDLEVAATTNPIFDVARFGVHFVASPRFADALIVTGPVGRAMQEPLRRCYDAMAEPRAVIAVGTCAISGGVHRDGYAAANGVSGLLPIAAYVPGCPPHPWSIIHGILLAMGREIERP